MVRDGQVRHRRKRLVPYSTIPPPQALFMVSFQNTVKGFACCCSDRRQHCLPRKLCKGGLGQRGKGGWINVLFTRDREGLRYETMSRVLYRAADGSWRTAEPGAGVSRLYRLKLGQRWTLLDDEERVMVIHPDRPP